MERKEQLLTREGVGRYSDFHLGGACSCVLVHEAIFLLYGIGFSFLTVVSDLLWNEKN
jgi:hypothetical protein